jgi:hypothetical protein
LQGNYYDFGENSGISTKLYGITAAGRVGAASTLEVNGGIFRYEADVSGPLEEFGDGGKETGFGIGAKYLISRESDPEGVRLAVGAGYFDVSGLNNQRVYGVATKYFGTVTGERVPITGHLGVRYDRYDLDGFGDSSKLSLFAGAEVPITGDGQFQAVGELGSKIADNGGTPFSRFRCATVRAPVRSARRLACSVRARSALSPTRSNCSPNWVTPSVVKRFVDETNPVVPLGAAGFCFSG